LNPCSALALSELPTAAVLQAEDTEKADFPGAVGAAEQSKSVPGLESSAPRAAARWAALGAGQGAGPGAGSSRSCHPSTKGRGLCMGSHSAANTAATQATRMWSCLLCWQHFLWRGC